MPDWYQGAVKTLLKLYQDDRALFIAVQLVIKSLKVNPLAGDYTKGTYRVYVDPDGKFRIGYNYHLQAKELEIVVIHVTSHSA